MKKIIVVILCFISLISPLAAKDKSSQLFEIASTSALVFDMQGQEVLYSEQPNKIVPIASITKLMTALVILEDNQPFDELLTVDIDKTKELVGVKSRVKVGSQLSRKDLLIIMLMSSENRAASALAHHYSKGYDAFITQMNRKASELGMINTNFVEPTGLSEKNISTAEDLTRLLIALNKQPLIQQWSRIDTFEANFQKPSYTLPFRNTNHLVFNDKWDIRLTKTGFTNAAGHCLVMLTTINNKQVTLVVLDAFGKQTHFADANRIKTWLETGEIKPVPDSAKQYKKTR
ncbi:D-alanyl-D-alanine endopeptidase [Thorsellia anophelis]|uniref:D-alanyl-D-alanine endopeptidase (Penicillin-binding protein 7) n=1 Tax=Thorsellia anophelis DSM 18579 TaxID=1123402 RepID=A0A1H9ZBE4_9GAMM|nr:D-alanyl-D-alanine endopeptidase [Thorsellia anophelis]SES78789.1 D-alanyl-D-alanine endopeptidase (penicillin-binding protein 7) [Thorsellia anophelis DSM 18579]